MVDYDNFPEIVGAKEVEKVVEIELAEGPKYRIEVIRVVKGSSTQYSAQYYERMLVFWKDGAPVPEETPDATKVEVWVPDDALPWVDQGSVSTALSEALKNVAQQRNNSNRRF